MSSHRVCSFLTFFFGVADGESSIAMSDQPMNEGQHAFTVEVLDVDEKAMAGVCARELPDNGAFFC